MLCASNREHRAGDAGGRRESVDMKKPTLGRGARAEARRGGSRIAEGATPLCEGLEQRVMLSTVVWDGGAGSMDWNTPANWDGDVLPTIADDVEIPPLGGDAARRR